MARSFDRWGTISPPRPDRPPVDRRSPPILREPVADAPGRAATSDPLARDATLAAVEAALFLADEPLAARKIASVAGLSDAVSVRRLLKKLQAIYDADESAFQVEELAGGFQLLTRPRFHRWLATLRRASAEARLSAAARETLAVVAYRQPLTRADIEAIRGVRCDETLRLLMERGYVRIAGRDDSLGRPVLYATTKKFLQTHGFKSLKDLPRRTYLAPDDAPPPDDPPA